MFPDLEELLLAIFHDELFASAAAEALVQMDVPFP